MPCCVGLVVLYLALRIRGTVTFQLAPGELSALIIEGTIPLQLAPVTVGLPPSFTLDLPLSRRLTIIDSLLTVTVGLPPSFTLDLPLSRIITSPLPLAFLRFNIEGKGTWSFGKRRNKTHILRVRCGRGSFHLQKSQCSACAFTAARKRTYDWSVKAIQRKTIGTGQIRYLHNVPRRFKSSFREVLALEATSFQLCSGGVCGKVSKKDFGVSFCFVCAYLWKC
ncbi:hypothetical protein TEA_016224 [Camellia sinensis var. sinensis]|uniref:Secreted protein n=1 Tax=Camellia sinensis var. sinensis TaxID=542762 RepID=A0A4S4E6C9_CAMSN|nr:hypothetical protein TEA_016224 [Camellia sinensis var. sinensis]